MLFYRVFFVVFFFVDEGRQDPNTTVRGPSSASQRNAISMAFRWRAADGTTLNDGLGSSVILGDPDQYC